MGDGLNTREKIKEPSTSIHSPLLPQFESTVNKHLLQILPYYDYHDELQSVQPLPS